MSSLISNAEYYLPIIQMVATVSGILSLLFLLIAVILWAKNPPSELKAIILEHKPEKKAKPDAPVPKKKTVVSRVDPEAAAKLEKLLQWGAAPDNWERQGVWKEDLAEEGGSS